MPTIFSAMRSGQTFVVGLKQRRKQDTAAYHRKVEQEHRLRLEQLREKAHRLDTLHRIEQGKESLGWVLTLFAAHPGIIARIPIEEVRFHSNWQPSYQSGTGRPYGIFHAVAHLCGWELKEDMAWDATLEREVCVGLLLCRKVHVSESPSKEVSVA